MSESIKFGRIRGKIELTSGIQTIEGYDLEFTTFKFRGLPGHIIDGAKIKLGKNTPDHLVVKGAFCELLKTGSVRIDITNADNRTISHFPHPSDNNPIIVDENSRLQITNLGNAPAELIEVSLPGFEKCILKNL